MRSRSLRHGVFLVMLLAAFVGPLSAQNSTLVVTAHPDDEAMFAATMWNLVREAGGTVDLAVVTDGAGGYRFSTLAEPLYGLSLTDPAVAAERIPDIRRAELRAGADIVGIRDIFHLGQPDAGKIFAVDSVFTALWDTDVVRGQLERLLAEHHYDLVITMLPVPQQHAHHKAAALLMLDVVAEMPEEDRPAIVGSYIGADPTKLNYSGLGSYPRSQLRSDWGPFVLDRDIPLGLDGRLNLHIVVNWLIAEHKSQGTMQQLMGAGRFERFWLYAFNSDRAATTAASVLQNAGLRDTGADF